MLTRMIGVAAMKMPALCDLHRDIAATPCSDSLLCVHIHIACDMSGYIDDRAEAVKGGSEHAERYARLSDRF